MKVYVLIDVSYDYYRFNEVVFASTDKQECIDVAKRDFPNRQLFEYTDEDWLIQDDLRENETAHMLIKEF